MENFLKDKFPESPVIGPVQTNNPATVPANSVQVGGVHYKSKTIQPWDYIVANDIGFLAGNVVKYVTRYKGKNGVQDLEKARHSLDKLIEVEKAAQGAK